MCRMKRRNEFTVWISWLITLSLASGLAPVTASSCPHPAAPLNARVSASSLTAGSTAVYTCDAGYDLFGSSSVTCGTDGKWSGKLPICATNVAYRKPVNQSTTARGGDGEHANDGDMSTVHDGNKCTQTVSETSPWWAVDLLQPYEITVVRITARGCCGHDQLEDLEIRVGDSVRYQENRLCTWQPGLIEEGTTRDLYCARPITGRYVMIQMQGVTGSMSLCEVQVYSTQEVSEQRCTPDLRLENVGIFNQTCYYFQIQEGGTYEIAKNKCAAQGATLAQHIRPITQKYITNELQRMEPKMTTKLLWIGVQKDPNQYSRAWNWQDGTQISKPLWAREQPNNYIRDQNCVMLDQTREWLWNDVLCTLNYLHWICQFSAQSCGSPNKNINTTVTITPATTDSKEIAVYSCPVGSMVEGDFNRTCQDSGLWGGEAPTCKYIDCQTPTSVDNGKFVLLDSRTTYSARVLYECAENYTLDGSLDTLECGSDSQWEPEAPQCLFSWCAQLSAPSNGGIEITGRRTGDSATFSCDKGYTLLGAQSVTCQLGGDWSDELPTCRFVDCNIPDDIAHGEMTLVNGTTYLESVATYECSHEYWLDGPKTRTCLKDGRWTGERPYCILINCGEPEIPHGGYVTGYSFDVGSEVEYHCEPGHYSQGDMKRVCTKEAKWSGTTPNCTFVDCNKVIPIHNGEIMYEEDEATYLDSTIKYRCARNYKLHGVDTRVCQMDGKWSGTSPKCQEIRCSNPEMPDLARISVTHTDRRLSTVVRGKDDMQPDQTYKTGSTVTYRCEKGYVVEGASMRTCLNNGTWSDDAPKCTFVECGPPEPIEPGVFRLLSNRTSYGATVSYECDTNWRIMGKFRRFCQENGTWSGGIPKCIQVECTELSSSLKGSSYNGLRVDDSVRTVGSDAVYSCEMGSVLMGNSKRKCAQGGVWEGEEPSCKPVVCSEPQEIINGRMIKLNDSRAYGAMVEYLCFPKYHLHGPLQITCTQNGTWSSAPPECSLDEVDLGILGDNTVDGSTNSARGAGELDESSNSGMWAGIIVSLLIVIAVALGLAFFRLRQKKLAEEKDSKMKSNRERRPLPPVGHIGGPPPPIMTYGELSDPSNGNNIYENIPDDLDNDPNYSELNTSTMNGSSNYDSHTYSNGNGTAGVGNAPRRQRPRMPPPQPPVVPTTVGVTINGMSINGR